MLKTDETRDSTPDEVLEVKREVVRKIYVNPDDITKMKRLSSLYADEIPEGAKEIDVISFFFNKSFELFMNSGEIERKLEQIKGM
jgi:hypothetical protein